MFWAPLQFLVYRLSCYRKLVDRANQWLRRRHHGDGDVTMTVKTCETMTWMSRDVSQLTDSESMVTSKSVVDGSDTYYLRGLRYSDARNLVGPGTRVRKATLVVLVVVLGISSPRVQKSLRRSSCAAERNETLHTHSCWHCAQIYCLRFFTYFLINE